jgi:hypothetical protein
VLIVLGGGLFFWWMNRHNFDGEALFIAMMLGGFAALIGILFLIDGRLQRRQREGGWRAPQNWFRRNLRYLIAYGLIGAVFLGVTIYFLPLLRSRIDDGDRSAQRIEGNGVTLVWAPQGPGWNWHPLKGRGRRPSWDDIALYGVSPVGIHSELKAEYEEKHASQADMEATGLCRYLSADGTALMPEPQDIWRMPTTEEIVRSLVGKGQSAGCTWDGTSTEADCQLQPNKDTPLWATAESPIYYWSDEAFDEEEAWYVPYTGGLRYGGMISHQPKDWGNARHGFRCVREP